ncbi:MAG: hypothetical protein NTW25_14530 [Candidatus Kapabacteria bacterium]|nr:hypothetical protein [Candidatus Kapabacteria bacterium]
MKKIISLLLLALLFGFTSFAKESKKQPTPKKGMISKVKDASARGFGWGLGREAAKETVKGIKKVATKVKEKVLEDKSEPSSSDSKK